VEGLDHLRRWVAAIAERPVREGVTIPPRADPAKQVESGRSILA
jgi:hypothetical protein